MKTLSSKIIIPCPIVHTWAFHIEVIKKPRFDIIRAVNKTTKIYLAQVLNKPRTITGMPQWHESRNGAVGNHDVSILCLLGGGCRWGPRSRAVNSPKRFVSLYWNWDSQIEFFSFACLENGYLFSCSVVRISLLGQGFKHRNLYYNQLWFTPEGFTFIVEDP